MDQRQAAVAEYLSLAHRDLDPDATDHIGPLLSYVLNLDEFHNAGVVRLFDRFHVGARFTPPLAVASAIRDYDGSDPAVFMLRLWRMGR